jgi:DNA polymerase-3 subunit epsilon
VIRYVLLLDTETTGLDHTKERVVEVAVVLYDVPNALAVESHAWLLQGDSNVAEKINRISPASLLGARDPDTVWPQIESLARVCDAVIAHNADFDRPWCPDSLQKMQWICSQTDLEWQKQTKPGSSLVTLTLDHDLGIAYAHRALTDCDMLARLFTRAKELGVDLDTMLVRGMRPKVLLQALVSYDDRELAKAAGFHWEATTKQWLRKMVADDASALPFKTRQIQKEGIL